MMDDDTMMDDDHGSRNETTNHAEPAEPAVGQGDRVAEGAAGPKPARLQKKRVKEMEPVMIVAAKSMEPGSIWDYSSEEHITMDHAAMVDAMSGATHLAAGAECPQKAHYYHVVGRNKQAVVVPAKKTSTTKHTTWSSGKLTFVCKTSTSCKEAVALRVDHHSPCCFHVEFAASDQNRPKRWRLLSTGFNLRHDCGYVLPCGRAAPARHVVATKEGHAFLSQSLASIRPKERKSDGSRAASDFQANALHLTKTMIGKAFKKKLGGTLEQHTREYQFLPGWILEYQKLDPEAVVTLEVKTLEYGVQGAPVGSQQLVRYSIISGAMKAFNKFVGNVVFLDAAHCCGPFGGIVATSTRSSGCRSKEVVLTHLSFGNRENKTNWLFHAAEEKHANDGALWGLAISDRHKGLESLDWDRFARRSHHDAIHVAKNSDSGKPHEMVSLVTAWARAPNPSCTSCMLLLSRALFE